MTKQLTQIGNSLGFIIEKPILELLNVDAKTKFEVSTDGDAITFRPVRTAKEERVRASARRMIAVHDDTLRKLAK
mgnify:CR=1 FL=1